MWQSVDHSSVYSTLLLTCTAQVDLLFCTCVSWRLSKVFPSWDAVAVWGTCCLWYTEGHYSHCEQWWYNLHSWWDLPFETLCRCYSGSLAVNPGHSSGILFSPWLPSLSWYQDVALNLHLIWIHHLKQTLMQSILNSVACMENQYCLLKYSKYHNVCPISFNISPSAHLPALLWLQEYPFLTWHILLINIPSVTEAVLMAEIIKYL